MDAAVSRKPVVINRWLPYWAVLQADVRQTLQSWVYRAWLLLSFMALFFALTIYPSKVHAQIIGELEANIPFQFHAGNAKFPAGKYLIHVLDNTDLTVMEIRSADGSTASLQASPAGQSRS